MKFCDKILSLRKEKGLSQEELGDILNVSRQTVSKWELGATYPETDKLILISKYFSISIDEILKDTEEMESDFKIRSINLKQIDYRRMIIAIFLVTAGIIGIILLGINSASNPHIICSKYCYDGFFGYIYGNKLQLIFYLCYAIITFGAILLTLEIKDKNYQKIVLVVVVLISTVLLLLLPVMNRSSINSSDNMENISN